MGHNIKFPYHVNTYLYLTNPKDTLLTMLEISTFIEDQTEKFKQNLLAHMKDQIHA